MPYILLFCSDVVREQKSGSGRVLLFGFEGLKFWELPPGFWVFKVKFWIRVGLSSAFRGWVGDFPLVFRIFVQVLLIVLFDSQQRTKFEF